MGRLLADPQAHPLLACPLLLTDAGSPRCVAGCDLLSSNIRTTKSLVFHTALGHSPAGSSLGLSPAPETPGPRRGLTWVELEARISCFCVACCSRCPWERQGEIPGTQAPHGHMGHRGLGAGRMWGRGGGFRVGPCESSRPWGPQPPNSIPGNSDPRWDYKQPAGSPDSGTAWHQAHGPPGIVP